MMTPNMRIWMWWMMVKILATKARTLYSVEVESQEKNTKNRFYIDILQTLLMLSILWMIITCILVQLIHYITWKTWKMAAMLMRLKWSITQKPILQVMIMPLMLGNAKGRGAALQRNPEVNNRRIRQASVASKNFYQDQRKLHQAQTIRMLRLQMYRLVEEKAQLPMNHWQGNEHIFCCWYVSDIAKFTYMHHDESNILSYVISEVMQQTAPTISTIFFPNLRFYHPPLAFIHLSRWWTQCI